MQDMTALRLYFPQSARAKPTRFWHRLSAPALSHHLLDRARRSGIHQALLHNVHRLSARSKAQPFPHRGGPRSSSLVHRAYRRRGTATPFPP